jgi:hypothetical protein
MHDFFRQTLLEVETFVVFAISSARPAGDALPITIDSRR